MRILFLFFLISLTAFSAQAQDLMPGQKDQPLEITARKTLEWLRNENKYVARGQAMAKQGDTSIAADTLTANYRETKKSGTDIYQMIAEGNVRIVSRENVAEGDKAVYDVDKGLATMTGKSLSLVAPGQIVTARDRFEYWVKDGRLNAIGKAHAVRGEDTMDADSLSAIFRENPKTGKQELSRLEADGNVVITTPTEVLRGEKGEYDAATDVAKLIGKVSIKRGPNMLEGDSADVNLTTNVSRMHGGERNNGRVRGVFYPNSEKGMKKPGTP